MNFKLCRHIRLAACIFVFLGLFLNNWNVVILGWTIIGSVYMYSINKIERHLEQQEENKKDNGE